MKSKEAKKIYKVYVEFYEKKPNLDKSNLRNLTIEFQSMAYILGRYGVQLYSDGFVKNGYVDLDLPMSMNIQDIIVRELIGKGEDFDDESLGFPDELKKKINLIGKAVRNIIERENDKIEALRLITFISFVKKYVSPMMSDGEIKDAIGCKLTDLTMEANLTDSINHDMCKDNYGETNIDDIMSQKLQIISKTYGS